MVPGPRLALKCLVAAGSLGLLLYFVPLRGILDVLVDASGMLFLAGLTIQFANRALATIHLRIITASQGMHLGRATLFRMLLAVQFYALILPGALAGGGATWLKYLQFGAAKGAAAAAVVINRGVALLVLVPTGLLALAADPRMGAMPPAVTVGLCIAGAAVLCLLWSPGWRALLPRASGDGRARSLIARGIRRLAAFGQLPGSARCVVVLGSTACELGNAAALWAFARAVGAPVDYLSVVWMRGALQLALLLPVTVAGLGIREASLVGLGSLVGVPATDAVAWSLTILAGSTVVGLAGGLLELTGSKRPRTGESVANTPGAGPLEGPHACRVAAAGSSRSGLHRESPE